MLDWCLDLALQCFVRFLHEPESCPIWKLLLDVFRLMPSTHALLHSQQFVFFNFQVPALMVILFCCFVLCVMQWDLWDDKYTQGWCHLNTAASQSHSLLQRPVRPVPEQGHHRNASAIDVQAQGSDRRQASALDTERLVEAWQVVEHPGSSSGPAGKTCCGESRYCFLECNTQVWGKKHFN